MTIDIVVYKENTRIQMKEFLRKLDSGIFNIIDVSGISKLHAFNATLDNLSGDYVMLLDSDGFVDEEGAKILQDGINNVDLVIMDYFTKDENARNQHRKPKTYCATADEMLNATVKYSYPAQLYNKIFRVSLIQEKKLRFEEGLDDYYSERLFFIDVLQCIKDYNYLPCPIYHSNKSYPKYTKIETTEQCVECCMYWNLLGRRIENSYKQYFVDEVFRMKKNSMDLALLKAKDFNKYIPTPVCVFWKQNWSLIRKIEFSIMYYLNKFGFIK